MATCLKAQSGAMFPISPLTRCAVLPAKYQFRFGLSGFERGWAVFDAGREYERRVRVRFTTVAQVPDQCAVLIADDGRWVWTTVCQTADPLDRFGLLEIDDEELYDDEFPELPIPQPEEIAIRFGNLELD